MKFRHRAFPGLLTILIMVEFPLHAFPVSRVGNNKILDTELGFSAPLPAGFIFQRSTLDGGIVLIHPQLAGLILPTLGLRPFIVDYPDLKKSSKEKVTHFFEGASDIKWNKVDVTDCSLRFLSVTPSTVIGVAVWGQGRGISVFGRNENSVKKSIADVIVNLKLSKAACTW